MKQPNVEIRKDIFERANSLISYKEIAFESGFGQPKKNTKEKIFLKQCFRSKCKHTKMKKSTVYSAAKVELICNNQVNLQCHPLNEFRL